MNSHWFAIVALAALLATGCRMRPEQRAMFDSYQDDLRRYEGIIYDLEYQNQVLCDENERLKKRLENAALGKPDKVDTGPRMFQRSNPVGSGRSDDGPDINLSPLEIEPGPASPRVNPGGLNKPVTPEADPESEPPVERSNPKPAAKPPTKPAEPLPDIDAPPGLRQPMAEASDDPPPSPTSILKPPGNQLPASKPATSEVLPPPRPANTKPRLPELLPAPSDKKGAQIYQADVRAAGFESRSEGSQRWTPRSPRRAASE